MIASISTAFTEQADYEKGFNAYFAQHIAPCLDNLEVDRKRDCEQFTTAALFGAFVVALLFALLFYGGVLLADPHLQLSIDRFALAFSKHHTSVSEGKIKILFFAGFLATIYPSIIYKRYGSEAKAVLLPPLLKFFGDLNYYPGANLPESRFASFEILPQHNVYNSDNHIGGELNEVPLNLAELTLRQHQGKSDVTVFRGIAIILQMNKPFEGRTIVKHREAHLLGHWLASKTAGLEAVTLEDITFDKLFEVYSSDQVEARYLLTTSFMERLMALAHLMCHWGDDPNSMKLPQDSGASGNLRCSFFGDSLLLMVPCHKDMFAPGNLFASAYRINEIRCVLYQVYLIRRLIETLKLDRRTGVTPPVAVDSVIPHVKAAPTPPEEKKPFIIPPPAEVW